MAFALVSYPRMLPQITRMTTGMTPDDPRFAADWETLLRDVGNGSRRPRSARLPAAPQVGDG